MSAQALLAIQGKQGFFFFSFGFELGYFFFCLWVGGGVVCLIFKFFLL